MDNRHFNQPQKRKAEFIVPPNTIKQKVGEGGISEAILDKAQALLEKQSVDFLPLAEIYLQDLVDGTQAAQNPTPDMTQDYIFSALIYPGVQLRSNGSMFHYPLVTTMADKLLQFLEVIETPDKQAIEIILAFHKTIKMVVQARIQGEAGAQGRSLLQALDQACERYFQKYGEGVHGV